VLVSVDMRDPNACGLQLADLRGGLGFNFVRIQTPTQCPQGKAAEVLPEVAAMVGVHQARDVVGSEQRRAVDQNQVTAYGKLWVRSRELNGVVECRGVGHESGGSHDAGGVGLHDPAIHSGSEPEIIRIDD